MGELDIWKLSEFFNYKIPLGVLVLFVYLIYSLYNNMYKKIKESFELCMNERSKIIADLSKENNKKDNRIKHLERQLDTRFKKLPSKNKIKK